MLVASFTKCDSDVQSRDLPAGVAKRPTRFRYSRLPVNLLVVLAS